MEKVKVEGVTWNPEPHASMTEKQFIDLYMADETCYPFFKKAEDKKRALALAYKQMGIPKPEKHRVEDQP